MTRIPPVVLLLIIIALARFLAWCVKEKRERFLAGLSSEEREAFLAEKARKAQRRDRACCGCMLLVLAIVGIEYGGPPLIQRLGWGMDLHDAVRQGRQDVVERRIRQGDDVNARDHCSMTPLHIAALNGRSEIAAFLLKHGADVDATDYYGKTALARARSENSRRVARVIERHSQNIRMEKERSSTRAKRAAEPSVASVGPQLRDALRANNPDRVNTLLATHMGAANDKNKYGQTALHIAVSHENERIAARLIAAGADVNVLDKEGRTPLDFAIRRGHGGLVRLLRKQGGKRGDELRHQQQTD